MKKTKVCTGCGKSRKSVKQRVVCRIDDDKPKGFYKTKVLYCYTCHKELPTYEG